MNNRPVILCDFYILFTSTIRKRRHSLRNEDESESFIDTLLLRNFSQPTTTQEFALSEIQNSQEKGSPNNASKLSLSWQSGVKNKSKRYFANFSHDQALLTAKLLVKSDIH